MPDDPEVVLITKSYEELATKMHEARGASGELVKAMEKDLQKLSEVTKKFGRKVGGVAFGGFGALQLAQATSLESLAEGHRDTFAMQGVGKGISYGGRALGNINASSFLGQKSLSYAGRGLQGVGGFLDFSALKMYEGALESVGKSGFKAAGILTKAFTPLKMLFNPITGAVLITADAMRSLHDKAVESRTEFERYTKVLSNFYQVTESGTGKLASTRTAIGGLATAYGKTLGISGKETIGLLGGAAASGFGVQGSEQLLRIAAATAREQGKQIGESLKEAIEETKRVTSYMTEGKQREYLEKVAGMRGTDYQLQRYRGISIEGAFERTGVGASALQRSLEGAFETATPRFGRRTSYEPGAITRAQTSIGRVVDIALDRFKAENPFARAKRGIATGLEGAGELFQGIANKIDKGLQQQAQRQLMGKSQPLGFMEKLPTWARSIVESTPLGPVVNLASRLFGPVAPERAGTEYLTKTANIAKSEYAKAQKEVAEGKKQLGTVRAQRRYKEMEETVEKLRSKITKIDEKTAKAEIAGKEYTPTKEEEAIRTQFVEAINYVEKNKGLKGGIISRIGNAFGRIGSVVSTQGFIALPSAVMEAYKKDQEEAKFGALSVSQLRQREKDIQRNIEEATKRGEIARKRILKEEIRRKIRLSDAGLTAAGQSYAKESTLGVQEKGAKLSELTERRGELAAILKNYETNLSAGKAGYGKNQFEELRLKFANLNKEIEKLTGTTAKLSQEFMILESSKLIRRAEQVGTRQTEFGIRAMESEGILGKKDREEISRLRGDKRKPLTDAQRQAINARLQLAQEEFETSMNFSRLESQNAYERRVGGIQVSRMRRRGIEIGVGKVSETQMVGMATGKVGAARKQAQQILSIREQMYEDELDFVRRYTQMQTDIIKTHYENLQNIERTRLYGGEIRNQNAITLGGQMLQGGKERAGIGTQVFQQLYNLLQERRTERGFKEASFGMALGIGGMQVPPEIQMIRGMRNLREQREDFRKQRQVQIMRERVEGQSSYDAMRTLKKYGYGEGKLAESEGGLNFMLSAYQQAMPDIARRNPAALRSIQKRMLEFVGQKQGLATRRFIGEERIKEMEARSTTEQIASMEKAVAKKGGERADPRLRADLAAKYTEAAASAGRRGDLEGQSEFMRKQEEILKTLPEEMKRNFGDKQAQMVAYLDSQVKILEDIRALLGLKKPSGKSVSDKGESETGTPSGKTNDKHYGPLREFKIGSESYGTPSSVQAYGSETMSETGLSIPKFGEVGGMAGSVDKFGDFVDRLCDKLTDIRVKVSADRTGKVTAKAENQETGAY
jgi:hypothetical protein